MYKMAEQIRKILFKAIEIYLLWRSIFTDVNTLKLSWNE